MSDTSLFEQLFARPQQFGGTLAQRRAQCRDRGHQYRVHGKANPTKLECRCCGVTWAIGPRTEPAT